MNFFLSSYYNDEVRITNRWWWWFSSHLSTLPAGAHRFIGEAVGHRKAGSGNDVYRTRVQKMAKFLEGGGHDDIETAQRLRDNRLPELPEYDPNLRSFVFMDVAIANKPAGGSPCVHLWCLRGSPCTLVPSGRGGVHGRDLCLRHSPHAPRRTAGRLVIELFDDHIPVGASHLRNRCLPGSRTGLAGSAVQKLVPHYAAFMGKS